jgi:hypothetical protein
MRFRAILAIIALSLAVGLFAFLPRTASAALISTVVTDTPTQLEVTWTWDPEESETDTPSLLNWDVELGSYLGCFDRRHAHREAARRGG